MLLSTKPQALEADFPRSEGDCIFGPPAPMPQRGQTRTALPLENFLVLVLRARRLDCVMPANCHARDKPRNKAIAPKAPASGSD